jgi:uncharacterized membrane protein
VEPQGASTALNQTAAQLQGGILRLGIGTAILVIASWEGTLSASGLPELRGVAENLGTLRERLASDSFDPGEVGGLLTTLGAQVQALTTSPYGFAIAAPLTQLSLLLTTGGATLASQAARSGPESGVPAGAPAGAGGTIRDFEQTETVEAPPDDVFEWLADVENLSKYLPPVTAASIEGPAEGGKPGAKLRLSLEIPNRDSFDSEGYLDADRSARRLRWGAEFSRDYSGWLQVEETGEGQSRVRVHLSFGPRSVEGEMEGQTGDRDPLAEGVSATLESIRRQIEEGAGKVQPPPPPPPPDGN